jgi:protein arginine kinase
MDTSSVQELLRSDQWLSRRGPEEHIAISSRARYARNLPRVPFPMRARPEELRNIVEEVASAVNSSGKFRNGLTFNLAELPSAHRHFLKENHLISSEMEKGGANRLIFLNEDVTLAIMVNEEDHLRLFAMEPGFQLPPVLNNLFDLETSLEKHMEFAFSPRYGFLTACPTNTGTGLRASVLLHLPALASIRQLADFVKALPQMGLTIRGPYGENSENFGDLFQISNEMTLGKNEKEIVAILTNKVEEIIAAEEIARRTLYETEKSRTEDLVWRSWGLLTNARVLTAQEAVQNLSRLRLGIDRGWFPALNHGQLNRLLIQVQPGHIQINSPDAETLDDRDTLRAEMIRKQLKV